jgi:hypothetical protein
VIEGIAVDSRDVNIRKPVVIKVGHGDAHAVAITFNARKVSYIRKGAIVVIVIETVRKVRAVLFQAGEARSVGKKISRYPSLS